MSSNKMKELVSIFGKEIGEEFNIINSDGDYLKNNPYHFTGDCIVDRHGFARNYLIIELVTGAYTIEKIPFVPKEGEKYWTYLSCGSTIITRFYFWNDNLFDRERKLLGILFKTEQEAEECLPIYIKKIGR